MTTIPINARFRWLIAFISIGVLFMFGLTIPLVGPDEARYAQVAREMFERGDWITPTLGGFYWFEKPALLYWLQIVSYHIFGVSEFAARFGPALCGLGTVASLWILGKQFQISNLRFEIGSDKFANWLALIAGTLLGIIVFAKGASFDVVITFTITASLVGYFVFEQEIVSSWKRRIALLSFYIFIGLAVLAKGLIGIIFPLVIVGFYHLISRRMPSRAFLSSLLWGLPIALSVAATWYLPMYLRHGWQFIDEFFVQHHFARFTSNKYLHPQPFYFFLWVLPLMLLPWTPFFIAALWRLLCNISASPRLPFSSFPLLLFSIAWLIVPLAFFSFSGSKLPGYILPSVPAAIIVTALFLFDLIVESRRWRFAVLSVAGATLMVALLLLHFEVPGWADRESVKSLMTAANEKGYSTNRMISLETLSHNAEFYFAGRLTRDASGRQLRVTTIPEVEEQLRLENGRPLLVLIPADYTAVLIRQPWLNAEIIKDNGELAIVVIWFK